MEGLKEGQGRPRAFERASYEPRRTSWPWREREEV